MRITSRLERLEKVIVVSIPRPTLVYVQNPDLTDTDQREAAIASYRANHKGFQGDDFNFISVVDEECKLMVERIMKGERTEKEEPMANDGHLSGRKERTL